MNLREKIMEGLFLNKLFFLIFQKSSNPTFMRTILFGAGSEKCDIKLEGTIHTLRKQIFRLFVPLTTVGDLYGPTPK